MVMLPEEYAGLYKFSREGGKTVAKVTDVTKQGRQLTDSDERLHRELHHCDMKSRAQLHC